VILLPEEFVVTKFLQYAGYAKYKRLANVYEGGCPICREGKSWGSKRRLFYLPKKKIICCHNCGWYSAPLTWIKKVSGLDDIEIIKEVKGFDHIIVQDLTKESEQPKKEVTSSTLPDNCINLNDPSQINFFKNEKVVKLAFDYLKERRLDKCINPPPAFYVSLTDKVHKNRLVIPFFYNKEIIFYQTRTLLQSDNKTKPKYLSKISGEKSLFNIDNVKDDLDYIFIFEGPIDSCFLKNGVGVTGIQERSKQTFNELQKKQLDQYKFHKQIFILDSQWQDEASLRKTKILLQQNEKVFLWPEMLGKKFKDFNDICINTKRDFIKPEIILNHTFEGVKGLVQLSKIKRYR
jgi:hypothetical protein